MHFNKVITNRQFLFESNTSSSLSIMSLITYPIWFVYGYQCLLMTLYQDIATLFRHFPQATHSFPNFILLYITIFVSDKKHYVLCKQK